MVLGGKEEDKQSFNWELKYLTDKSLRLRKLALSYEVTLMFYFGFIVDCCLFLHVYSVEYNILGPSFGPIKSAEDVVKDCVTYFCMNSFY